MVAFLWHGCCSNDFLGGQMKFLFFIFLVFLLLIISHESFALEPQLRGLKCRYAFSHKKFHGNITLEIKRRTNTNLSHPVYTLLLTNDGKKVYKTDTLQIEALSKTTSAVFRGKSGTDVIHSKLTAYLSPHWLSKTKTRLKIHIRTPQRTITQDFKLRKCELDGTTTFELEKKMQSHLSPGRGFACHKKGQYFSMDSLTDSHLKKDGKAGVSFEIGGTTHAHKMEFDIKEAKGFLIYLLNRDVFVETEITKQLNAGAHGEDKLTQSLIGSFYYRGVGGHNIGPFDLDKDCRS